MAVKTGMGIVAGILAAASFGYFVWPFRYQRISDGFIPSAVDHLTGRRVFMGTDGWQSDSDLGDTLRPELVAAVRNREGLENIRKAKTELAVLRGAIDQFRLDTSRYPTAEEGFGALRHPVAGAKNWRGPYLVEDVPNDPWGSPYLYETPGKDGKHGYRIKSLGAVGILSVPGNTSEIVDGSD